MRQRSSCHHRRQLSTDQCVVVADSPTPPRQVNAQLERRQYGVAADWDDGPSWRRVVTFGDAPKSTAFRIGEQSLPIHGDAIDRSQVAKVFRMRSARRHLGKRYRLERPLDDG